MSQVCFSLKSSLGLFLNGHFPLSAGRVSAPAAAYFLGFSRTRGSADFPWIPSPHLISLLTLVLAPWYNIVAILGKFPFCNSQSWPFMHQQCYAIDITHWRLGMLPWVQHKKALYIDQSIAHFAVPATCDNWKTGRKLPKFYHFQEKINDFCGES